jgi:hypothetical protein
MKVAQASEHAILSGRPGASNKRRSVHFPKKEEEEENVVASTTV